MEIGLSVFISLFGLRNSKQFANLLLKRYLSGKKQKIFALCHLVFGTCTYANQNFIIVYFLKIYQDKIYFAFYFITQEVNTIFLVSNTANNSFHPHQNNAHFYFASSNSPLTFDRMPRSPSFDCLL